MNDNTQTLQFVKGHGTGNDFILYTDPEGQRPLTAKQIAWLCDRRFGVGADGVIRAIRSAHLPEGKACLEVDTAAEWFMDYTNADGSIAQMCGNGVRVFAHYLLSEGLTQLNSGDTLVVGTRAGVKDVQRNRLGYQVDLGRWRFSGEDATVRVPGGDQLVDAGVGIDLGNPHVVVTLPEQVSLSGLSLLEAPILTPAPAEGANVEFVVPASPVVNDGVGELTMRVYERGSGETLSCGTGAVAAALATRQRLGAAGPHHWRVTVPGGRLGVRMFPTEEGEHVALSGPAELVFRGEISLPAPE